MVDKSVDLVIPVYRPDEKFERLVARIGEQTVRPGRIFLMQTLTGDEAVDEKLTKRLLAIPQAVVTTLPRTAYDHGGTRNKGASMSEAEYVLFMTQDAVPTDEYLIENLLKAMEDESVATAYARQLPSDEVGPIETYTREFNYPPESRIKSKDDLETLGIKTYFCSNVCALYRHSVYDELGGFVRHTIFNEDSIMAAGTIGAGYKIAYVAEATVVHAHKYTYRQQLSRNFDLAVSQRQYREIFDAVPSESEGKRLVKMTAKHLLKTGRWYLLPDLVFQSGFKYMGYFLGKRYRRLPKGLVKRISMNKAYWK
ncbi:MAG: glycosyltransferase [Eubacterium sp.]|nr:glycosyltransferase [Eubacterium sp.]